MKWKIEINSRERIDSALFKVYLDIKKKLYIKNQPLPTTLTKLDCDCDDDTKYSVNM